MTKSQRKVTSKQVAERAGVSQTTVSFVLNRVENSNISEETRQRVLEAARELRYVPDTAAQALARGRSNNIALVLTRPHRQVFIDEYIPSILTGLSEVTQKHGFRVMVELTSDAAASEAYDSLIRGNEIAGMIVNPSSRAMGDMRPIVAHARERFPIVTLREIHPDVHSVMVEKLEGTRALIEHLIRLGHKRIACISYAKPDHSHALERLAVYRKALTDAGIGYDEALVRFGAYDPDTGYEAVKSLLEGDRFSAVYAMNDVMAFGAITAIQEAGLRVPEDIAVVGFDDIRLARYCTPPLTTVHEPDIEQGRQAGEMLIDLINGIAPPEKHVRLGAELVVRRSCGAYLQGK